MKTHVGNENESSNTCGDCAGSSEVHQHYAGAPKHTSERGDEPRQVSDDYHSRRLWDQVISFKSLTKISMLIVEPWK